MAGWSRVGSSSRSVTVNANASTPGSDRLCEKTRQVCPASRKVPGNWPRLYLVLAGRAGGRSGRSPWAAVFHIGAHSSCASCSSASARSRSVGSPSGAVRLRSVMRCRSASPATSRRSIPMYACVHGESRRVVTPLVRSTTLLLLPPPPLPLLPLLPLLRLLFSKTFGRWAARPFGHLRTSTHDMLGRREWRGGKFEKMENHRTARQC